MLTIAEAEALLRDTYEEVSVRTPPAIFEVPVNNLDEKDPFFDSLREQYDGFDGWLLSIMRKGRKMLASQM